MARAAPQVTAHGLPAAPRLPLGGWWALTRPHLLALGNFIKRGSRRGRAKGALVALFGLLVWLLVFAFSVRVLENFLEVDVLGEILARRFMGLMHAAGLALIMFSALISAVSNFFLARDLDLIMSAPVSLETVFWARSARSLLSSVWMPAVFMLPVFMAYGYVFKAAASYYFLIFLTAVPLLAGAGFISLGASFVLVNVLPARKAREVMGLLAIVAFCLLYLAFRVMRPEDLLSPEKFVNAAAYLAAMDSPASFFDPTEWAVQALWPSLTGRSGVAEVKIWLALLWSTAAALAALASYAAALLYWPGYNKSLEGAGRGRGAGPLMGLAAKAAHIFKPQRRAIAVKDFKIFFRDQAQWSQLLLLAALMAVYLYNFSILNLRLAPVGAVFLENAFAVLNVALSALVAATLALRFAFTSISGEGLGWWIIKSAPLSLKEFMTIKLWLWLPPIWLAAMALTVLGNYYLGSAPKVGLASALVTAHLTPGLCALAVGLGAQYPSFSENVAQAATGYGGLAYMVTASLASALVIALSLWPAALVTGLGPVGGPSPAEALLAFFSAAAAALVCARLMTRPLGRGLAALIEDGPKDDENDCQNV